jgi:hypothetical protein
VLARPGRGAGPVGLLAQTQRLLIGMLTSS